MDTDRPVPRYALYFAPDPASALWRFGSGWLGYDAWTGGDTALSPPPGWTEPDWRDATAEPRRYGFHATLKAPFRLAADRTEGALVEALHAMAATAAAVPLGPLVVASIGDFVALVPASPPSALLDLASRVVLAFEPFRAPLSDAERLRRRPGSLTPRQRDLVELYGYPFVLEQFRFHMTLTGRQPAPRLAQVAARAAAEAAHAGADAPVPLDRLALFRQASPGERFRIVAAAALRPSA